MKLDEIRDKELNESWWDAYDLRVGEMSPESAEFGLDFFSISAPKTGTTWLYQNLICHNEIFIPLKEIKYFCTFWRWYDINWYVKCFSDACGRLKGEIDPAFALLPVSAIRKIHTFFPKAKLIFLMRNPIERTWSHIKHDYRYHVSGFAEHGGNLENKSLTEFTKELWLDYYVAFSDYASILKRWMTFFPAENIYVDFTDTIARYPNRILSEIFDHIGIKKVFHFDEFLAGQHVLKGWDVTIPLDLRNFLSDINAEALRRLDAILGKAFNMKVPDSWNRVQGETGVFKSSFANDFGLEPRDEQLMKLLDRQRYFSHLPRMIEQNYKAYNILFYQGCFWAIACDVGSLDLRACVPDTLSQLKLAKKCLVDNSPQRVKQLVDDLTKA